MAGLARILIGRSRAKLKQCVNAEDADSFSERECIEALRFMSSPEAYYISLLFCSHRQGYRIKREFILPSEELDVKDPISSWLVLPLS